MREKISCGFPVPECTCYKKVRAAATHQKLHRQPVHMFLLIDNYDSFTYNLYHFLSELGAQVEVRRNDALSAAEALAMNPQGIILSPGPCDPPKAGICLELIAAAQGQTPLLGVCLGHQAIGMAYGGRVERGPQPMHGKVSTIRHSGQGVFQDLSNPLDITRYHSLIVAKQNLPDDLIVTAETDDGVIMGLQHRQHPVHGVQFHPESIASQQGHDLLANFLRLAGHKTPLQKSA